MRLLRVNCVFLILEGLAALGLCVYWSLAYPEHARMCLGSWSWTRDAVVTFGLKLGLGLVAAGCAGYLLAVLIGRLFRRRTAG
ncbi:MAG TPA: hypothetical protein VMX57_09840 [Planctomycetota bacterium]|nr:hypothetical protein [Planctomycetota bacterium]